MPQSSPKSLRNKGSTIKIRWEDRFNDEARFLKTWFDRPLSLGAVSPSGPALAKLMASYVDPEQDGPVIELGPGTGALTQALVERGVAPERLVLIEFDPAFCDLLRKRFPAARIIQGDAYHLAKTLHGKLSEPAAAIVSGLPLFTRPEHQRLSLLHTAFDLMRPDAPFIQFTYAVVSPMPLKQGGFLSEVSQRVWLNIPPACVWVYRRPADHVPAHPSQPLDFFERIRERTERMRAQILR